MKTCTSCREIKETTEFLARKKRSVVSGIETISMVLPSTCKRCESVARMKRASTSMGKEKSRLAQSRYRDKPEKQQLMKAYRLSDAGKQSTLKYEESVKGQARNERYDNSVKGLLTQFRNDTKARSTWREDAPDTLTAEELEEILRVYNGACAYCRKPLRTDVKKTHRQYRTLDHVIPIGRGGGNTKDNVVPCCFSCNIRKNTRKRTPRPLNDPLSTPVSNT